MESFQLGLAVVRPYSPSIRVAEIGGSVEGQPGLLASLFVFHLFSRVILKRADVERGSFSTSCDLCARGPPLYQRTEPRNTAKGAVTIHSACQERCYARAGE